MVLSVKVFVQYLSCEKNQNKQKEAGFCPFKNQLCLLEQWLWLSWQSSHFQPLYQQEVCCSNPVIGKYLH